MFGWCKSTFTHGNRSNKSHRSVGRFTIFVPRGGVEHLFTWSHEGFRLQFFDDHLRRSSGRVEEAREFVACLPKLVDATLLHPSARVHSRRRSWESCLLLFRQPLEVDYVPVLPCTHNHLKSHLSGYFTQILCYPLYASRQKGSGCRGSGWDPFFLPRW